MFLAAREGHGESGSNPHPRRSPIIAQRLNDVRLVGVPERGVRMTRPVFDPRVIQPGARTPRPPPSHYGGAEAEYWHLLEHVALWDVGVERQVEVSGPDGFAFAQLITPRDLSKVAVGEARYVVLVGGGGGILNDPVMLRLGENTFWYSLADSDVLLWALGVATHAGLDVRLHEPDVWPLQVQGPKSKSLMGDVFGNT